MKKVVLYLLSTMVYSAGSAQDVYRHAVGASFSPVNYDRFAGFSEMSLHSNLDHKSRKLSNINQYRNDEIAQRKRLFGFSIYYSAIRNKVDREFSFQEIRLGASYKVSTTGYYIFEGGRTEFDYKTGTQKYQSNYYDIDMQRFTVHGDLIFSGEEWGRRRGLLGIRAELGTYYDMKLNQGGYPQPTQVLTFKTRFLANLQLIAGGEFRMARGLSFRTEFMGGFGQLYFLRGSNYLNKLFSISTGFRYAW